MPCAEVVNGGEMVIITIEHYYKDPDNPHLTKIEIKDNVDYAFRYALFMALLDNKTNFVMEG